MLTPVCRKHPSSRPPWEVYQSLYPRHRVSFFLDSHAYAPPAQRYSYIGFAPFLELTVNAGRLWIRRQEKITSVPRERFFPVFRKILKQNKIKRSERSGFLTGGAVGYAGYEMAELCEPVKFKRKKKWAGIPDLYFGFYRDLIVYDHREACYWLVTHVRMPDKNLSTQSKKKTAAILAALQVLIEQPLVRAPHFHVNHFKPQVSRQAFCTMVRKAKSYIAAGDIYQANLSQRFDFDYSGNPPALYSTLRRINPSPFASFLKINSLHLLSSSPERLIRKQGNQCETQPIAGTRPRKAGARGARLKRELLRSEKERAEHLMLVDLERNDLGRVCQWPTVKVREFMKVEKYSHVIHLVSRVTGILRPGRDALDLFQALFPGGTITGCPKIRCMQIIDELEPETRGIYTGSIGYFDFSGDMDMNIVIRTLVLKCGRGFYQTGAGIVHDSTPEREYAETRHKGRALELALRTASGKKLRPRA